jgi:hypothetical protein
MKTLMIEDLSRDDELTVEEMKTIKGGFFAFHASADAIDAVAKTYNWDIPAGTASPSG